MGRRLFAATEARSAGYSGIATVVLDRVTKPREVDGKTVKGINFFEPSDSALLHALQNSGNCADCWISV
jgi:hypothetical protein